MSTYKNAMDKTVLDYQKKDSLKNLYNQKKVVEFKKKKSFVKPISVIAASLAVIIALGVFFTFGTQENSSFVLTVNAKELDKNNSAYIKLDSTSQIDIWGHSGNNMKTYDAWGSVPIYVHCTDDNVETIKYSTDRGAFFTSTRITDNKIIDGKIAPFDKYNSGLQIDGMNSISKCYYNFTVKYKDQPDSFADIEKLKDRKSAFYLSSTITGSDLTKEKRKDLKDYVRKIQNVYGDNFVKCSQKILSTLYDGTKITVTAKYDDGREESQTLELSIKTIRNEKTALNQDDFVNVLEVKLI